MEPEELLECEMCQYRKAILKHLNGIGMHCVELIADAMTAYGVTSDITLKIRDIHRMHSEVFNQIYLDAKHCEGDESIAMPLNDHGYRDEGDSE